MIRHFPKYRLFCLAIIGAFFLGMESAAAISLSPTKQTIVIRPGRSELMKFEITNDSAITKKYLTEIEGFKIDEQSGRPQFGQPENAIAWITPLKKEITLTPGAKGFFSFKISAPGNALPGGHYLALFAKEKSSGGEIGVSARVGSLLFLYTEGAIVENLSVASFRTGKFFLLDDPAKFFLTLTNTGNIHLVPEGQISLIDNSGKIIAEIAINELNRKVLPGRFWIGEYSLPMPTAVGPIRARADITYGLTKMKLSATVDFWLLPVKFISLVFGLCLALIMIYLLHKKIQKK